MDVPEPAVTFRVRPFWEAVDTGILLFRRWPLAVASLSLVPPAVLGAVFWLLWGNSVGWLVPLLLWWFRPVGDRLLLAWVGGRFFQPDESGRAGLLRCLKALDGALLADLTWRRFHPWADALAPVSLLERVPAPQRRVRRRWLAADLRGPATGLASAFLLVELVVGSLLWGSGATIDGLGLWGATNGESPLQGAGSWTLLVACLQATVAPFFALGSFGLYVNVRTRKEGWDLALTFRTQRRLLSSGRTWVPVVLAFALGTSPGAVQAQGFEPPVATGPESELGRSWAEVTAGPEFGRPETRWTWRAKNATETKPGNETALNLPEVTWSAELLRTLAVAVAVVLVLGAAGWLGWRSWSHRSPARAAVGPGTASSLGLEEALRLWHSGDRRAALAQLYRAGLELARIRFQLEIPPQATEQDCLRSLGRISTGESEFAGALGNLVALWSETAWAGRPPSPDRFEAVVEAFRRAEGAGR